MREVLGLLVPATAEALLVASALGVWVRLRRQGLGGVYQLTVMALMADGLAQAWQLGLRWGQPAGVAWLVHLMVCGLLLYVMHRLGHLLRRVRERCEAQTVEARAMPVDEGGLVW